jgi:hypothetical protein
LFKLAAFVPLLLFTQLLRRSITQQLFQILHTAQNKFARMVLAGMNQQTGRLQRLQASMNR